MKKTYISPVCEGFLTDQEGLLATGSAYVSSGATEGTLPPGTGEIGTGEGEVDENDFAKGMVWDNTIFD